jgi:hypothetical protein
LGRSKIPPQLTDAGLQGREINGGEIEGHGGKYGGDGWRGQSRVTADVRDSVYLNIHLNFNLNLWEKVQVKVKEYVQVAFGGPRRSLNGSEED